MTKKILITGATDGIGLATVKLLASKGHHLLLHGRNAQKLADITKTLKSNIIIEQYVADLSDLEDVKNLVEAIKQHDQLDVLINNAGVLKTATPLTKQGLDVRFMVNTIAPFFLTQALLPLFNQKGRIINLSSAAQTPVNLNHWKLAYGALPDMEAYAQSKLAIILWTNHLVHKMGKNAPLLVSVNPGSLLASKMVQEGFGIAGKDIEIGAKILDHLALEDGFIAKSGLYYDNDHGCFANPHPDALNPAICHSLTEHIKKLIDQIETS